MSRKGRDQNARRTTPWRSLALLLGALLLLAHAGEEQYNLMAVDDYVLPAYAALVEATGALAEQSEGFCRKPDEASLAALRQRYHRAMDAWQYVQPVRLGPIEQELRAYRIQFWPDKRQSVNRHLSELLARSDEDALKPRNFARSSVAVQGFSALERLLFETGITAAAFSGAEQARFRCRLTVAITRNLHTVAREVVNGWERGEASHRQSIATAARGNAVYTDSDEVSARLFNGLHTQLELMIEQKLRAPLGPSDERARGRLSESWRSGRSLENLARNLDGVRALLQSAFLSRLVDPPLTRRIQQQLTLCEERLSEIGLPLSQAVADDTQRPRVEALARALTGLKQLVVGKLAPALEIPIGFNSLDGD